MLRDFSRAVDILKGITNFFFFFFLQSIMVVGQVKKVLFQLTCSALEFEVEFEIFLSDKL